MRVVFLQYGGDYREAVQRIKATGQTTYYAQRHSIDVVAALVGRCELVAVVCVLTSEPYDEVLESGVRAIGAGMSSAVDQNRLVASHRRTQPRSSDSADSYPRGHQMGGIPGNPYYCKPC